MSLKTSVTNAVANAGNLPSNAHIYLFGSACHREQPKDIDILYVYDTTTTPSEMAFAEFRPLSRDIQAAIGIQVHPTVLSTKELADSQFLQRVEPIELRRT